MTFKKILSGAIAVATLVTSVGMFPVSAAYDVCDVNRDGVVNVRDVSAIASYRAGNVYVPNYNQLDADKNLVINSMDEQRVLAEVMGWSYHSVYYSKKNKISSQAPAVSSIDYDNDENSMAEREYIRYSYKQQKVLPNYKLKPSTTQLNSLNSVDSRAIIGADDRYIATGSENSGVVFIKIGEDNNGTGFIVGDHQIATAAHCVYSNGWITPQSIIAYGYNGKLSNTTFTPVEAHVPKEHKLDKDHYKYDYALVTVEEDLSDYVHFDLGTSYSMNKTNCSNIPIYVKGCPDEAPGNVKNTDDSLYTAEGRVIDCNPLLEYGTTGILFFDTDTSGGESGGPVYTVTKNNVNGKASYTYTALAVFHGGITNEFNMGALMTKHLIQFYRDNSYANY